MKKLVRKCMICGDQKVIENKDYMLNFGKCSVCGSIMTQCFLPEESQSEESEESQSEESEESQSEESQSEKQRTIHDMHDISERYWWEILDSKDCDPRLREVVLELDKNHHGLLLVIFKMGFADGQIHGGMSAVKEFSQLLEDIRSRSNDEIEKGLEIVIDVIRKGLN
jgi:hypothetical protein